MAINNKENYPMISIVIAMTILAAIALPAIVEAQSPAGAPEAADPCMTALFNMSDCLSFVTTGSNETKPAKDCCPELAGLVESNPICLCQLLGGPDKLGISIDLNRALQLPSLCKVQTPPVSTCAAIGIPVAAPTGSPTASSPAASIASPPPSSLTVGDIAPGVAAESPTSNRENGGSSFRIRSLQCFVGLAFIIVSTFFRFI